MNKREYELLELLSQIRKHKETNILEDCELRKLIEKRGRNIHLDYIAVKTDYIAVKTDILFEIATAWEDENIFVEMELEKDKSFLLKNTPYMVEVTRDKKDRNNGCVSIVDKWCIIKKEDVQEKYKILFN